MQKLSFLDNHFQCEIRTATLDLDPVKVMQISQVYSGSPAEKFGIRAGDLLTDVNQEAPFNVDIPSFYGDESDMEYIVYRPEESKAFLIKGSSLPLGMKLESTTEAIVKNFAEYDIHDYKELYLLWQRSEWSVLLRASRSFLFLDDFKSQIIQKVSNWQFVKKFAHLPIFKKLIDKSKFEGPEILTYGIALFETGNWQEGVELIELYLREHIGYWTTEWHALTYYYLGLHYLAQGDRAAALELFEASEVYCRCPVLQKRLAEQGVHCSIVPEWNDIHFPVDFSLPDFAEKQTYKLSELMNELKEQQLLYLCVMPSYRCNGPYNRFLYQFNSLLSCFPENTSALYVITDKRDEENLDTWLKNERVMLANGKPIVLLYDEDRGLADVLEQSTSPNIYALNKEGLILNSGIEFTMEQTWSLLQMAYGDVLTEQQN